MIDAGHELDNLKSALIMSGLSEREALNICSMASSDIQGAVIDIVSDALQDVVSGSESVHSRDFVNEVMAIRDGNLFKITTTSGRSDFSEPPFPMLPKLLTNAKVSKDGSRYKKIPMRENLSNNNFNKTIESAILQINKQREQLKVEKENRRDNQRTLSDPMDSIGQIRASESTGESKTFNTNKSVATQFRTASDKQDPNTKWVRPAKQADMSDALDRVNNNIQDQIDRAISQIISNYKGSF
jgi:hypothetical protein